MFQSLCLNLCFFLSSEKGGLRNLFQDRLKWFEVHLIYDIQFHLTNTLNAKKNFKNYFSRIHSIVRKF